LLTEPNIILSCKDLAIEREGRILLNKINVSVASGELLQITGENGVGKTSLLRSLVGFMPVVAGTISKVAPLFYLGHDNALKLELTVEENVLWDARFSSVNLELGAALTFFDLTDYKKTALAKLSQGQRRRVALVKLYLSSAKLYILDEPFSALDENAQEKLSVLMQQKLDQGAGIVLTSHQPIQQFKINKTLLL